MNLLRAVWKALESAGSCCASCRLPLRLAAATATAGPLSFCRKPGCPTGFADGPARHTPLLPLLRAAGGVLAELHITTAREAAASAAFDEVQDGLAGLDAFQPTPAFLLKQPSIRQPAPWDAVAAAGEDWRGHRHQRNAQADADKREGLAAAYYALYALPPVSELASMPSELALARSLERWPRHAEGMEAAYGLVAGAAGSELMMQPFFLYKLLRFVLATAPRDAEVVDAPGLQSALASTFRNVCSPPTIVRVRACGGEAQEASFAERAGSGITHAFHGAPLNRWFSILRHGLLPLSDTHMSANGASAGRGVYVASSLSMSLSYTATRRGKAVPAYASRRASRRAASVLPLTHNPWLPEADNAASLAALATSVVEAELARSAQSIPPRMREIISRAAGQAAAAAATSPDVLQPVIVGLAEVPLQTTGSGSHLSEADMLAAQWMTSDVALLCPLLAAAADEGSSARMSGRRAGPGRVGGPFAPDCRFGVQPTAEDLSLRCVCLPAQWCAMRRLTPAQLPARLLRQLSAQLYLSAMAERNGANSPGLYPAWPPHPHRARPRGAQRAAARDVLPSTRAGRQPRRPRGGVGCVCV